MLVFLLRGGRWGGEWWGVECPRCRRGLCRGGGIASGLLGVCILECWWGFCLRLGLGWLGGGGGGGCVFLVRGGGRWCSRRLASWQEI